MSNSVRSESRTRDLGTMAEVFMTGDKDKLLILRVQRWLCWPFGNDSKVRISGKGKKRMKLVPMAQRWGMSNFKNINKLVKGQSGRKGITSSQASLQEESEDMYLSENLLNCSTMDSIWTVVSVESINKKKYCLVVDCMTDKQILWVDERHKVKDHQVLHSKMVFAESKNRTLIVLVTNLIMKTLLRISCMGMFYRNICFMRTLLDASNDYTLILWIIWCKFDGNQKKEYLLDITNCKGFRVERKLADSKKRNSCDDAEDLDDQQFIVHTHSPMPPEEQEKRRISIAKKRYMSNSLLGFDDSAHPNKVYSVVKALLWPASKPQVHGKDRRDISWYRASTVKQSNGDFKSLQSFIYMQSKRILDDQLQEDVNNFGRRLVSWQCKKQTIVAISSTEAEYVAAGKLLSQFLWMQIIYLIMDLTYEHIEILYRQMRAPFCIVKKIRFSLKGPSNIQIRITSFEDSYEQRTP
ncbi:hypothetical protein Tco_1386079 [Tanacetum coccineum]